MRKTPGVLAIASTADTAPVLLAQRLRKGAANSARGAGHLVTGAPAALGRILGPTPVLCRFDSAYYGHVPVSAAFAGGADVSVQVTGRLVVRRIPELNPKATDGQGTLFDAYRFHAFFTTVKAETLDTVAADKVHREHAII